MTNLPSPQPKLTPYLTIIPTRHPVQKMHTSIGHAKNAMNGKMGYYRGGAGCDMEMYEHVDGEWVLLYTVKQGDREVPWRAGEIEAERQKERRKAQRVEDEARKRANAEARLYYENVIGTPSGEDYKLFVEGYVEGYMSGRRT